MFIIPGSVISVVTFPGIVIHELAHYLFCRFFKVPVFQVCYFRFGNPAGYVLHGKTKDWAHQVLLSAGPSFVNSLLGAFLAFPSALRVFEFDSDGTVLDGVLIWMGVSIAMHAIPSTGDAQSMWAAVSGKQVGIIVKICIAPIVGLLYLLRLGSVFWLDAIYGVAVCRAFPKLLVLLLS